MASAKLEPLVLQQVRALVAKSPSWAEARQRVVAAYGTQYLVEAAKLAVDARGNAWLMAADNLVEESQLDAPAILRDSEKLRIAFSLLEDPSIRIQVALLHHHLVRLRPYSINWVKNPSEAPEAVRDWYTAAANFVKTEEFIVLQGKMKAQVRDSFAQGASKLGDIVEEMRRVSTSRWNGSRDRASSEWWREQE